MIDEMMTTAGTKDTRLGGREADAGSGANAPAKQVVSRREAAADASAAGLQFPEEL
jgi:hypothetical protein